MSLALRIYLLTALRRPCSHYIYYFSTHCFWAHNEVCSHTHTYESNFSDCEMNGIYIIWTRRGEFVQKLNICIKMQLAISKLCLMLYGQPWDRNCDRISGVRPDEAYTYRSLSDGRVRPYIYMNMHCVAWWYDVDRRHLYFIIRFVIVLL